MNAFEPWKEAWHGISDLKALMEYFPSLNTLWRFYNMKSQFVEYLLTVGYVSSKNCSTSCPNPMSSISLEQENKIKAIVCTGLLPPNC